MSLNIYLIRKCLLPLRNPLTIENIPVFHSFEKPTRIYINIWKQTNCLLKNLVHLILMIGIIYMKTL